MNPKSFTRRDWLAHSGMGIGSLALATLLAESAPKSALAAGNSEGLAPLAAKAKRVIFLFMHGGPSAVDTFDYKPALAQYDGQTAPRLPKLSFAEASGRSASTLWKSPWTFSPQGESGIMVSELFPHVGRCVDDICFLNSCHGSANDHGAAVLRTHTGTESFVRPSLGSWVLYGLGSENESLPGFVTVCPSSTHGGARNYGSAFLPAIYQGTPLGNEKSAASEARFRFLGQADDPDQQRQLAFLRELNQTDSEVHGRIDQRINAFETAFRMQAAAPGVVDIEGESKATRELYGLDDPTTANFGTQCLLARRFAEAGVRFIQVSTGPKWDQHTGLIKMHAENARACDKPIAGLLQDLKSRGMLDSTLVVWGGEFGRTPTREGKDGRDHNPHGYTMWLAGGGVRGGTQVGSTDELGFFAADNKIHLHDFHATLLALLGLDHEKLTYRYAGRDFRLTDVEGRIVREVFA